MCPDTPWLTENIKKEASFGWQSKKLSNEPEPNGGEKKRKEMSQQNMFLEGSCPMTWGQRRKTRLECRAEVTQNIFSCCFHGSVLSRPIKRLFLSVGGRTRGPHVSRNTCRLVHWHSHQFLSVSVIFVPSLVRRPVLFTKDPRFSIIISAPFAWTRHLRPFFLAFQLAAELFLQTEEFIWIMCSLLLRRYVSTDCGKAYTTMKMVPVDAVIVHPSETRRDRVNNSRAQWYRTTQAVLLPGRTYRDHLFQSLPSPQQKNDFRVAMERSQDLTNLLAHLVCSWATGSSSYVHRNQAKVE